MKRDYMADYKENIYFENSKYWYSLFSLKSKSILIRKEYYSFEQITDCIVKLKSNKEDSLTTLYHILFKRSITCKDAQVKDNLIIVTHDMETVPDVAYYLYDYNLNAINSKLLRNLKFVNENTISYFEVGKLKYLNKNNDTWNIDDFKLKLVVPIVKESIVDFYKNEIETKDTLHTKINNEVKKSNEIFKPKESDYTWMHFIVALIIIAIAGVLLEAVNNAVSAFFSTFNPYILGILFIVFLVWLMNKK